MVPRSAQRHGGDVSAVEGSSQNKEHTGLIDAQKLLASIALSRPTPFGAIPHRRRHLHNSSSSPPKQTAITRHSRQPSDPQIKIESTSGTAQSARHLHPLDVGLSAADAFDYRDSWSGAKPDDAKGKAKAHDDNLHSPLSPTSPPEEWDRRSSASARTRSRQATSSRSRESTSPSTPASSRSSSLRRKPSLLSQCASPPVSSSHNVPALGRSTIAGAIGKESKSLAERGSLADVLPSLYSISRGRSAHVSPSRRWDRRGASASVLSSAPVKRNQYASSTSRLLSHAELTSDESVAFKSRKDSTGSLEAALFSSDDDGALFASDDEAVVEDVGPSHSASRRSSVERDRRRELRILLAPSTSQDSSSGSNSKSCSHSVTTAATTASDELVTMDDKFSSASSLASNGPGSPNAFEQQMYAQTTGDLADDESDGTIGTSAASILHRRSRSGRRLQLGLGLADRQSTMNIIPAGMIPGEKLLPEAHLVGQQNEQADISGTHPGFKVSSLESVPVDPESDPLLGTSFGSVADNMQVEPVVWDDASSRRNSTASNAPGSLSPRLDGENGGRLAKKTVAQHEDERRTGFAAAYQQRISALSMRLWAHGRGTRDAATVTAGGRVSDDKVFEAGQDDVREETPQEGLLSSSWRHLTMLPNLLLMPTLGAIPSKDTDSSTVASTTPAPGDYTGTGAEENVLDSAGFPASIGRQDAGQIARRDEALHAAQAAIAHLARSGVPRTIVAIDRALDNMQRHPSSAMSNRSSPQDVADEPLPTRDRTETQANRKGRGVMTPLEADADISAYVSGLGLPIDPDVELSSVVHLQTFRTDTTRARRSTSVSKAMPSDVPLVQHRRTNSEGHPKPPVPFALSAVHRSAALPRKATIPSLDDLSRRRSPSSPRKASFRIRPEGNDRLGTPKCSRPAAPAPVPGNYSAYNSSASEDDTPSSGTDGEGDHQKSTSSLRSEVEDKSGDGRSRGRGRATRRRRRSTSPVTNQQCAIGLFSSSPTVARTRSGRRADHSVVDTTESAPVLRVRSSPNLTAMQAQNTDDAVDVSGNRRGRAGSVKRVSASVAVQEQTNPVKRAKAAAAAMRRTASAGGSILPAPFMAGSRTTAGAASASRISGMSTAHPSSGASQHAASPSTAAVAMRLPIVGADSISHLAGQPSMVSNGAHLLMLSLELEMMRNRKITGSLKPRWLKARMRTEPFGPAAIVAMMAQRATCGAEAKDEESHEQEPDADIEVRGRDQSPRQSTPKHGKHISHEHRARIGLHTSHHSALHHGPHHLAHGRHQSSPSSHLDVHGARPRRGSALRFEVLPSASHTLTGSDS